MARARSSSSSSSSSSRSGSRWASSSSSSSRSASRASRWSRRSPSASGCWSTACRRASATRSAATSSSSSRRGAPTTTREVQCASDAGRSRAPRPIDGRSDTNFIKRVVGVPGDALNVEGGRVYIKGKDGRVRSRTSRSFVRTSVRNVQPAEADHDSEGSLFYDGRQPWEQPPTAAPGDPSPRTGSSAEPSSPTGRRSGSGPRRKRPRGRKLFAFDRSFERRFIAGADEAGRGCLAGPAGDGRGAIRHRAPLAVGPPRARPAERLQAAHRGRPRGALPARPAGGREVVDRRPLRARHRLARPARLEPRRPAHRALQRVACEDALCLVDGFRLKDLGYEQRAIVDGDTRAPRSRRHRSSPRSPATATCGGSPTATRVGLPHERRLLDARAPRRDPRARHQPAAPAVVRVDRLPAARARRLTAPRASERVLQVVEGEQAPARADAHADRVEAQLGLGRLGSRRPPLGEPLRGHRAHARRACTWPIESNGVGPPRRPRTRVFTSQKTRQRSPAATMSSSP